MTKAIRDLKQRFNPDVLICDLPPMLASDDVAAFLPNVDCVILVVEAEADTLGQVDACERELAAQTNVLGVVLNKCRQQNDLTANARGD
jgi:MinD-like ATPase involved in chromosome partitioning or flagellar assembly